MNGANHHRSGGGGWGKVEGEHKMYVIQLITHPNASVENVGVAVVTEPIVNKRTKSGDCIGIVVL